MLIKCRGVDNYFQVGGGGVALSPDSLKKWEEPERREPGTHGSVPGTMSHHNLTTTHHNDAFYDKLTGLGLEINNILELS